MLSPWAATNAENGWAVRLRPAARAARNAVQMPVSFWPAGFDAPAGGTGWPDPDVAAAGSVDGWSALA